MSDARPIGYGAMLGEGTLALLAVLATTAGFASLRRVGRTLRGLVRGRGAGAEAGRHS